MDFKQNIINEIKEVTKAQEVKVEIPPDPKLGDFAIPCFQFSKLMKKDPQRIAQFLKSELKNNVQGVKEIKVIGPYLNFFIDKTILVENVLKQIIKEKNKYGSVNVGNKKTIAIDYSHPNIAKPFNIGHLRSTIIGNSLYKMFIFLGYKVQRLNYLGDWGTQFGKIINAYLMWGDDKELEKGGVGYLVDLYVRYNKEEKNNEELHDQAKQWFKKLEEGDKTAKKLWKQFHKISLDEFKKIYVLLGTEFDSFDGESSVMSTVSETIDLIKQKGITEMSDDALVIPLGEDKPPAILLKADGATTYLTRDLAAIRIRNRLYDPVKIIYVVGGEQKFHFNQIFTAAHMMEWDKAELLHIDFGLYLDKDGKKLSTRKGKIILMKDVLYEAVELASKIIKQKNPHLKNKDEVAKMVGIGAIMFGDLVNDRIKDVVFDWDRILDFNGDTAPYIQYSHARICSILRKALGKGLKPTKDINFALFRDESEHKLVTMLSNFSEIIIDSINHYKPSILCRYLLDLAQALNEFYHRCVVIDDKNPELSKARLLLVDCVRQVLANGLDLLGIRFPQEM